MQLANLYNLLEKDYFLLAADLIKIFSIPIWKANLYVILQCVKVV